MLTPDEYPIPQSTSNILPASTRLMMPRSPGKSTPLSAMAAVLGSGWTNPLIRGRHHQGRIIAAYHRIAKRRNKRKS